jgi:hypothetical protein
MALEQHLIDGNVSKQCQEGLQRPRVMFLGHKNEQPSRPICRFVPLAAFSAFPAELSTKIERG